MTLVEIAEVMQDFVKTYDIEPDDIEASLIGGWRPEGVIIFRRGYHDAENIFKTDALNFEPLPSEGNSAIANIEFNGVAIRVYFFDLSKDTK